jgi:PST family polysaccharide transporter
MSADYYPKLSSLNKSNELVNKAVIEQTKIVLLIGTPLVLLMFTFIKIIVKLLYTSDFLESVPLIQWMLLSVFLRFISYPIGYVFLAKNKSKIFIFTQTTWNVLFLVLVNFSLEYGLGLEGIGLSFSTAYLVGVFVNFFLLVKVTNFKYDLISKVYITVFSIIVLSFFILSKFEEGIFAFIIELIVSLLVLLYSFKELEKLIGISLISLLKVKLKLK